MLQCYNFMLWLHLLQQLHWKYYICYMYICSLRWQNHIYFGCCTKEDNGSNLPRAKHNISLVLWSTLEQTMLLYHCCIYFLYRHQPKNPPFQRNCCVSHHFHVKICHSVLNWCLCTVSHWKPECDFMRSFTALSFRFGNCNCNWSLWFPVFATTCNLVSFA